MWIPAFPSYRGRVIVLDFDDTLYPTSLRHRATASTLARASRLDHTLSDLMMQPNTHWVILTGASEPWVRGILSQWMPRVASHAVPVLSTGDRGWHGLFAAGKYRLLRAYLEARPWPSHLLSVGDGQPETQAMHRLRQEMPHVTMTHIKCERVRTLPEFFAQLEATLHRVATWVARTKNQTP